ncbi:lanthionine synthetase C family protein [Streptomyces sp. PT12]|uniref:lanthionine synthetase C family protein n=1 Tax=Streptomyces sp. PT12 TaxID=1510197 RepID=UPI000DE56A1A|nr:lanthionine synthetase C family protein [Streptomyces sp. PT12]RBM04527.1 lantibiotic modifying enzyme [Streptomyces sp. PT12]
MRANPEALDAADTIAAVLTDPRTAWATAPPGGRAWPQSLAGGAAGVALLHIERARSGRGDWATAHAWLSSAAAGNLTAAANAGLYMGAPALAFVLNAAANSSTRYQRALEKLDVATITVTRRRLADAHVRIDQGDRPAMKEFDLIRGLAGLGIYHLTRHPHHEITRDVLAYLVRLTEPLPDRGLPPWWTDLSPNGTPHPDFPSGHGNFGLSHGIGSVLALLSFTLLRGLAVTGTRDAVERICAWTDQWRQHDDTGPWWPGFVTLDQVQQRRVDPRLRPRPSWCYGIAGTARAQQLAGQALGDTARQRVAETAMLTTLRDPAQLDLLPDIGLCHGKAGLLQAAWRMAADARTPGMAAGIPRLAARLTGQITQPSALTDPELLDGAAGAALALHTLGTATAPTTGWDAILLLG